MDHVGHKHLVNHLEMSRKLRQYDLFISALVEKMKSDPEKWGKSMMIVIGDHGQTDDGAHGGALPQEVFIFVKCSCQLLRNDTKVIGVTVMIVFCVAINTK